jgi:hypothetical protein
MYVVNALLKCFVHTRDVHVKVEPVTTLVYFLCSKKLQLYLFHWPRHMCIFYLNRLKYTYFHHHPSTFIEFVHTFRVSVEKVTCLLGILVSELLAEL